MAVALAAGTAALIPAAPALADTPGTVDTTFGSNGSVTVPVGITAAAGSVAVQPDGDIVTAGQAVVGTQNEIVATRMTPTGALDPSFGVGGIETISVNGGAGVDSGDAIALQSDGKIVIAGTGRAYRGGPLGFAAVRLLPNGTPDPSFGSNGAATVAIGSNAMANGVVIQPDGKIALDGVAQVGTKQFAAARFNSDGTLDTSFGAGGTTTLNITGAAWGLALQSSGKLVLAGQAPYGLTGQQFMAARLTAGGTLDPTFGNGGTIAIPVGSTALGYGVALQSDGKPVIAGPAFTTQGVAATARLTVDGRLDPTYGKGGIATYPDWNGVNAIIIDSQDRVLLPTVGNGLVRLLPDGSSDQTFGTLGSVLDKLGAKSGANGAAIQPDGKIVLAGSALVGTQGEIEVTRINGGGTVPTTTIAKTANVRYASGRGRHGRHRAHRRHHHRVRHHRAKS